MRVASWLIPILMLAGIGSVAWHYGYRAEEAGALVEETRATIDAAEEMTLERAADYWLGTAAQRSRSDPRGSGTALALAIRLGRAEAIRTGVEPVPDDLKRAFDGDFTNDLLDDARWTVATPDSRLGRVLARWPVEEGAVTLGNVIVFKTERAAGNRRLFAHELAHVEQYRDLGISEFARRYAADPAPIEAEARAKAERVTR